MAPLYIFTFVLFHFIFICIFSPLNLSHYTDLETEISLLKDLKSLDKSEGPVENVQAEIDKQILLEDKSNVLTVESDAKESSKVINTELTSSSDSDVEIEPVTSRERLDSGVGSSLTRASRYVKSLLSLLSSFIVVYCKFFLGQH